MLENCISLNSVDLSNFSPKNRIQINYIFSNCKSLASINFEISMQKIMFS